MEGKVGAKDEGSEGDKDGSGGDKPGGKDGGGGEGDEKEGKGGEGGEGGEKMGGGAGSRSFRNLQQNSEELPVRPRTAARPDRQPSRNW